MFNVRIVEMAVSVSEGNLDRMETVSATVQQFDVEVKCVKRTF